MNYIRLKPYVGISLLLLVAIFPLFNYLDALPIQKWDEARYANNALEMYTSHNWLVLTYDGSPDMWYTKPPLMVWLQVLSLNMFGINELAIRMPAALAALGTCMTVYYILAQKCRMPLWGAISVLLLVTIKGYVGLHGTRTGDLDSLLTLLTTGYILSFFVYLDNGSRKHLYLTFLLLLLAILTKSIQAVLFLPALLVYTIYKKKLISLLKTKDTYIGIAIILFVTGAYYLAREHYSPGYLQAVWVNEVSGRYNTVIEGHQASAWYYLDVMTSEQLSELYLLVIPGFILGLYSIRGWVRDLTLLLLLAVVVYMVVISFAQTKLGWYPVPLYPLLAIVIGLFCYNICEILKSFNTGTLFVKNTPLPFVFLFILLINPYVQIIKTDIYQENDRWLNREERNMAAYLKKVLHGDRNMSGCAILNEMSYQEQINWYYKALRLKNYDFRFITAKDVHAGDTVLAFISDTRAYLEATYNTKVLEMDDNVIIYKIGDLKDKDVHHL